MASRSDAGWLSFEQNAVRGLAGVGKRLEWLAGAGASANLRVRGSALAGVFFRTSEQGRKGLSEVVREEVDDLERVGHRQVVLHVADHDLAGRIALEAMRSTGSVVVSTPAATRSK